MGTFCMTYVFYCGEFSEVACNRPLQWLYTHSLIHIASRNVASGTFRYTSTPNYKVCMMMLVKLMIINIVIIIKLVTIITISTAVVLVSVIDRLPL